MSISSLDVQKSLEDTSMFWAHNAPDLKSAEPVKSYMSSTSYDLTLVFAIQDLTSLIFQWTQFGKKTMREAGKLWDPAYPQGLHNHLRDKRILIVFQGIQREQLPWLRATLAQTERPFPHYVILSLYPVYVRSHPLGKNLALSLPKNTLFSSDPALQPLRVGLKSDLKDLSSLIEQIRAIVDSPFIKPDQESYIFYIQHIHDHHKSHLDKDSRFTLASLMLDVGLYYAQTGHYTSATTISRQAKNLILPEQNRHTLYLYIHLLYQIGRLYFYQKMPGLFPKESSKRCLEKAQQLAQENFPRSMLSVLIQRNGLFFHTMEQQEYDQVYKGYQRLSELNEVESFDYKNKQFSPLLLSSDLQHKATCLRYQVEAFVRAHKSSASLQENIETIKRNILSLISVDTSASKWASSLRILLAKIYMIEKKTQDASQLLSNLLTETSAPDQRLDILRELIVCHISQPEQAATYARQFFDLASKTYGEGHRSIYEMTLLEDSKKIKEFREKGLSFLEQVEIVLETTTSKETFVVLGYGRKDRTLILDIQILINKSPLTDLDKLPKAFNDKLKPFQMDEFVEPSKNGRQLLVHLDKLSYPLFEKFLKNFESRKISRQQATKSQPAAQAAPIEKPIAPPIFQGPNTEGDFVVFKSDAESCTLTRNLWNYLGEHNEQEALVAALNLPPEERKKSLFFNPSGYRLEMDEKNSQNKAPSKKSLALKKEKIDCVESCSDSDEDDAPALDEKQARYAQKEKSLKELPVMQKTFGGELLNRMQINIANPSLAEQLQLQKISSIASSLLEIRPPAPTPLKQPHQFSSFEEEEKFLTSRSDYLKAKRQWHRTLIEYQLRLEALSYDYSQDMQALPPTEALKLLNTGDVAQQLADPDNIALLNFKDPQLLAYHTLKHYVPSTKVSCFDVSGKLDRDVLKNISDQYLASARETILNYDLLTQIPNQRDPNTTEYIFRRRDPNTLSAFFDLQDQLTRAEQSLLELCHYQGDLRLDSPPKDYKLQEEMQKEIDNKRKHIENLKNLIQKQNQYSITTVASQIQGKSHQVFIRTHFTGSDLDPTTLPPHTIIGHFTTS